MTKEEFTEKIREGWPGSPLPQIEAIGKDIHYLTDKQRGDLFDYFLDNYPYQKVTAANFRNIMKQSGIKQRRVDLANYAYRCRECGRIFAGRKSWFEVTCCPNCLSREMIVVEEPKKADVQTYQQSCLMGWAQYNPGPVQEPKRGFSVCPIWSQGQRAYGPACDQYAETPGETDDCRYCSCRNCCEAVKKESASLAQGIKPKGEKYF
jgi:hypothetical protein